MRAAWANPDIRVTHINDLGAIESSAYLLKFDSVHGTWGPEAGVRRSPGSVLLFP